MEEGRVAIEAGRSKNWQEWRKELRRKNCLRTNS
jgi:hypothetical protein